MTTGPHHSPDALGDNQPVYKLKLFVTGASPNSTRAVTNIKKICDTYLPGKYELEVIDVYQQPITAETEQIIAIPLLIRKFPLPERRIIGDMSNITRVLKGLEITNED
jgi:circadian clock protein KaiB